MSRMFGGRRALAWSLGAAILAAVGEGAYVWGWIRRFADVSMHYDEGMHAYHLLRAASQLAAGSLGGYLKSGIEQVVYPPGYSWIAAPLVVWLGGEVVLLRGLSLVWYLTAAIVAWRAASGLSRHFPCIAGLIATLLVLTSTPLIIFASNIMLDSIGLLLVFVFLHLWGQLRVDSSRWKAAATGLLAGLSFLIKYPFGVFVGAAMALGTAVECVRRRPPRLRANEVLMLGSAALVVSMYLILPGRFADFRAYGTLQPATTSVWTLGNMLYYGQSLISQYAVSPLIGLVVLVGVGMTLFLPSRPGLFRWALFFWVGYAILTLKSANEPRFAAVVIPSAFVVAGVIVAEGVGIVAQLLSQPQSVSFNWGGVQIQTAVDAAGRRLVLLSLVVVLGVLFATTAYSLQRRIDTFPTLMALSYKTDALAAQDPVRYAPRSGNLSDLYRFVSQTIDDPEPRVIVLNTFNELNAPTVGWRLSLDRFGVAGAGAHIWPKYAYEYYPDDYAAFRERLLEEGIEYVVLLRDARWSSPHWEQRGLIWYLRHDLQLLGSELFTPTIIEDSTSFDRLLANYEYGPPELEGRLRGLSKEWPHVVDVFRFVPDGFRDDPLPDLYALLDLPLQDRNYALPHPEVQLQGHFDDKVTLLGYDMRRDGDQLEVTFYWQGQKWMNEDYHVFIHFLDPTTGALVFGYDLIPKPDYPIQWWAPGEVVDDTVMIDLSGVSPGSYRLGVGIYDFETMERLPAEMGGAVYADGWLPLDEAFRLE